MPIMSEDRFIHRQQNYHFNAKTKGAMLLGPHDHSSNGTKGHSGMDTAVLFGVPWD